MNTSPAILMSALLASAVALSACSSDGVGFGAGVNGIRVNPPPGSTPPPGNPPPAAAPASVTGTTVEAGVGSGAVALAPLGATLLTPPISAKAASDRSVSIGGDTLLSAGNLALPDTLNAGKLVGSVTSAVGIPAQSSGTATVGASSNALSPVTGLATSLTSGVGAAPALGADKTVNAVLNGASALVSTSTTTVTGLTSSLSAAVPTQGTTVTTSAATH